MERMEFRMEKGAKRIHLFCSSLKLNYLCIYYEGVH